MLSLEFTTENLIFAKINWSYSSRTAVKDIIVPHSHLWGKRAESGLIMEGILSHYTLFLQLQKNTASAHGATVKIKQIQIYTCYCPTSGSNG